MTNRWTQTGFAVVLKSNDPQTRQLPITDSFHVAQWKAQRREAEIKDNHDMMSEFYVETIPATLTFDAA